MSELEQAEAELKVVAVTNHKGGAGKTTTTVCLAGALADMGWRVLVVDLDAQASASSWLGIPLAEHGRALLDALVDDGDLVPLVKDTSSPGVECVPNGFGFAAFDRIAASEAGGEFLLRRALHRVDDRWDVVLLDCPPSLDRVTVNALVAGSEVLLPVALRYPSLEPLGRLFQLIAQVGDRLNTGLGHLGIVGIGMDKRKRHPEEVLTRLKEQFGELVFDVVIRETIRFPEATANSQVITAFEPKGLGAEDFRALAGEVAERLGRPLKEEKKRGVAHG